MSIELTEDEMQLILSKRAKEELIEKKLRFRREVFKLACEWCDWYEEEKLSLTMSVFIDNFKVEKRVSEEFKREISLLFNSLKAVLEPINEKLDHPGLRFK